MELPKTAQEVHETLYDGADIKVFYKDGTSETIKVRKIPRNEFSGYASAFGNEEDECAYYCAGRDADWVGRLSEQSFDAVLEEGQRLNFTPFSNWFRRQTRRLNLLKGQSQFMDTARELMAKSPILQARAASMNGLSSKGTATGNSGDTAQRN